MVFGFLLTGASALFLLSKAWFLAPYRVGWLMLLANAVYETVERRLRVSRGTQDAALFVFVPLGLGWLAGPLAGLLTALAFGAAWVGALVVELRWRSEVPAVQFGPLRRDVPLPVPRLIVLLRGPVLERSAGCYQLGDWPEGLSQSFELLVLNPGLVRPQLPLRVEVTTDCVQLRVTRDGEVDLSAPEPGQVCAFRFEVKAQRAGPGGAVRARVTHGDQTWEREMRMNSVLARGSPMEGASIRRWPYGARAGFVWRGDHDLYDPGTLQSVEGLRIALGLAARYRMPTSVMLSARLSLVQEEHEAFCRHFGWNRRSAEIPEFARFLREEVDVRLEQEFPTASDRPYAAEIGNHFYLHYGTHAAADAANGWTFRARMGQGHYPWLSGCPADSFTEQRDNAIRGSDVIEAAIGVRPASFTIPGDVYDRETARAMEAAGLEVGTETDCSKLRKLLVFPAEHHPEGCERFVELTRMLPRDPQNAAQLAMLKFWIGFARRNGRALVYLAHHHLAMYEGNACYQVTAELLRHVLADTEGDVYPATLTALGRYWRDVLSERTRCVNVTITDNQVTVKNDGPRALNDLPVEIETSGGQRHLRLVSVPANSSVELEF